MAVGFDNGAVIVYDLSEALQRSMMNGTAVFTGFALKLVALY